MIGHAMIRVLGAFAILALLGGALHAQTKVRIPPEAVALAGQHPAEYYRQAAKLFSTTSRKDDAVFVFYLGQLRYRAHLQARRDLKPDGDPALFGSLSEVVGRPLNEYAFGDLARLADVIDAVLAYDAANPDRFTPPAQFPNVYVGVRDGLIKMKAQLLKDADQIRETRRRNGLENRK
jgi:hypothetical protein